MRIIVGLGNPGEEYAQTRHNVGFAAVDSLHEKGSFSKWSEKKSFKALVSEGEFGGEKMLLVKPLTFMNLSGEAVAAILSFYKQTPDSLLVIYDDIDLPLGTLRLRKEGSSGTHNGMRSLVQHVGSNFPRLRIGIDGRTPEQKENQNLADYVLGRFGKSEQGTVNDVLGRCVEALEAITASGMDKAMEKSNQK